MKTKKDALIALIDAALALTWHHSSKQMYAECLPTPDPEREAARSALFLKGLISATVDLERISIEKDL